MIANGSLARQAGAALVSLFLLSSCTAETLRRSYLQTASAHLSPPTRPVVVLSGFGNTKLFDPETQRYVWGTAHSTVQTRYADNLDLPIDPERREFIPDRLVPRGFVGSRGPLNFAWHISRALERYGKYTMATNAAPEEQPPRTVYRFAYDWRLSATDNARELDRLIEQIRRAHRRPELKVDIVAHSLGGFITLTYLRMGTEPLEAPELWDRGAQQAASKIANVVLLGAPQLGAADAFRVLIRPERFVMRVLAPEWTATYPSLTEMLPADGRLFVDPHGRELEMDVWDLETWRRWKLSIFSDEVRTRVERRIPAEGYEALVTAFERSLRRAKQVRRVHDRPLPSAVRITAIAGDCIPTTRRVLMRPDLSFAFYAPELRQEEKELVSTMLAPGDGSITLESATAGRAAAAAVFCNGHQGMALDAAVHHAILRALQNDRQD
jgi:pimeloyl-ACP methyl ester carboxylesterase